MAVIGDLRKSEFNRLFHDEQIDRVSESVKHYYSIDAEVPQKQWEGSHR